MMMEKPEIVVARHKFRGQIHDLSRQGQPFLFLVKTWVTAHHTVGSKWYDTEGTGKDAILREAPTEKGQRLIVLHAQCKDGFLPGCALVFVESTNSAYHHDKMNDTHFNEWWEHSLLPNLPAGVVVVMDNVPYHTVKTQNSWLPVSSTRKADMQTWPKEKGIPWTADSCIFATAWHLSKASLSSGCLHTTVSSTPSG